MHDDGMSSSTSHVVVRPWAEQMFVESERRWGDSGGLDWSSDARVGVVERRRVVAKEMAVGENLMPSRGDVISMLLLSANCL